MATYGVTWNQSTDAYSRTGDLDGVAVGSSPGNGSLPIQANMKRCVINDSGVVQYYLKATDSTKKADDSAADLTGADGQVMVEIPKFWYKHSFSDPTHTWEISNAAADGFEVHPAFLSGSDTYDKIYIGAYEAVLYDNSASAYIDYSATWKGANNIDSTADKLGSVSGKMPVATFTRAQGRAMAARRGTGWTQELYDVRSAVQLLFLIEYASFYSQSMIGAGITNTSDWSTYNNIYPLTTAGNSNGIGNATGNTAGSTSCATEATKYMSYRGVEQWYGHIHKWLDGINTNNRRSYVCNVAANLADDTSTNYTDIGVSNVATNGYQASLLNIARGFLPASVGADSATKLTDYYYQVTGWQVASSGGSANNADRAGAFYLYMAKDSSYSVSNFGSRLCFRGVSASTVKPYYYYLQQ
jgi:hypothetical protein